MGMAHLIPYLPRHIDVKRERHFGKLTNVAGHQFGRDHFGIHHVMQKVPAELLVDREEKLIGTAEDSAWIDPIVDSKTELGRTLKAIERLKARPWSRFTRTQRVAL